MKVYYAHPISTYGTMAEKRDVQVLESMRLQVVNPNTPECDAGYKLKGMDYFDDLILECQALAFRAFADGSIPAGIAKEIEVARENGRVIFELPSAIERRTLSVMETRAALKDIGYR